MSTPRFFISYSRLQFYFAEALALALQRAGISVWLDVQQLAPGSNWDEGIQHGLQDCEEVILVASTASLSSPYVEAEWDSASKAGKPVHVVLFEAVKLPSHLQPASVVDMRGNFRRGVRRLTRSLQGGEVAAVTKLPSPSRMGIPWKIPVSLWMIFLALAITGFSLCASALNIFVSTIQLGPDGMLPWEDLVQTIHQHKEMWQLPKINGGPLLIFDNPLYLAWVNRRQFVVQCFLSACFVGIGALYMRQARRFLTRQFSYRCVRTYLALSLVCVATLALLKYSFSAPADSTGLLPAGIIGLVTFLGGVLSVAAFFLMSRSDAVYRWLPTGEAARRRRQRYGRRSGVDVQLPDLEMQGRPIRYALSYAPGDSRIAGVLRAALHRQGHQPASPAETSQYHIAVLSNLTTMPMVANLVSQQGTFIPVLATSVDVGKNIPDAGKHQWIDCRRMAKPQLRSFAQYLRFPQQGAQAYGLSVLPQGLQRLILPRAVSVLTWMLRILAVYLVVRVGLQVVGQVVATVELIPTLTPQFFFRVPATLAIVSLTVLMLYAALMLGVAELVVLRKMGSRTFLMLLLGFVTW